MEIKIDKLIQRKLMSLSDLCHGCHGRQFTELAIIVDPDCVGYLQSQDDCGSCNIRLDEIPQNMREELIAVSDIGYFACQTCDSTTVFIGERLFSCDRCYINYNILVNGVLTGIFPGSTELYHHDVDELFMLDDKESFIFECLGKH